MERIEVLRIKFVVRQQQVRLGGIMIYRAEDEPNAASYSTIGMFVKHGDNSKLN